MANSFVITMWYATAQRAVEARTASAIRRAFDACVLCACARAIAFVCGARLCSHVRAAVLAFQCWGALAHVSLLRRSSHKLP